MQRVVLQETFAALKSALNITASLIILYYFYRIAHGEFSLL